MMRWILMLALLGVGVTMALVGGRRVYLAQASQGWPTVMGKVTGSRVQKTPLDTSPVHDLTGPARYIYFYRPVVSYTYSVDGTPYTSDTVSFERIGTGGEADAQAVSRQYPVGLPVTVHYDPDDPVVACLQCGRTEPMSHVAMLGGMVFVLVAVLNLVELARAAPGPFRRQGPDRTP